MSMQGSSSGSRTHPAQAAASKRRKERLKAQGVCVNCGHHPAALGSPYCSACKKKTRERQRERVAQYRREGRCIVCGRPAVLGGSWCAPCLKYKRDKQREYYQAAKAKRQVEEMNKNANTKKET